MQVLRLLHPFPGACLPPSVLPREGPGIMVLPSSALPHTGVRISHPTPKDSTSSFLAHLGTSPRASQLSPCTEISHQHFAAPWWLSEEKHVLLCGREAEGPMARVVSRIWPLASIPSSFQTPSDLLLTFSQPLLHLLDTVYLFSGKHPCATHPEASSQCLRTETHPQTQCCPSWTSPSLFMMR